LSKKATNSWGIYYGWIIVAVAVISMAFWFGIRSSFSVFYVALLEDFPWSRGETAGVQSMAFITYTILAPLVGGLIDRLGPRRIIGPGILFLVLGLILCCSVRTLFQFYLFYGVIVSAGVTCISIVPYSAILAHWFAKKLGLASGIAASGMGVGTFFLVPLSQYFIELWGWRITFAGLGGLVFIILFPLVVIFLRHRPQDLGLMPDGLRGDEELNKGLPGSLEPERPEIDWTFKKVLGAKSFWALLGLILFAMIGVFIVLVHHVKFLIDTGIDKMTVAMLFGLIGIISSGFRVFWGWLSDRIGRELAYTMGMICICIGVCSLLLIEAVAARVFVYPFFVFFGIGWAVTAPMFIAAAADLFKGRIFGLIYGIMEGGVGIGAAFGAWIAGYIFDRAHSYQWAFALALAVLVLSGLLMWVAAPGKALSSSPRKDRSGYRARRI
jgi:sugar phosphate permease